MQVALNLTPLFHATKNIDGTGQVEPTHHPKEWDCLPSTPTPPRGTYIRHKTLFCQGFLFALLFYSICYLQTNENLN